MHLNCTTELICTELVIVEDEAMHQIEVCNITPYYRIYNRALLKIQPVKEGIRTSCLENDVLSMPDVIASQDLADMMQANKPYMSPTPRASLWCLMASTSARISACQSLQYVTRNSSVSVYKKNKTKIIKVIKRN